MLSNFFWRSLRPFKIEENIFPHPNIFQMSIEIIKDFECIRQAHQQNQFSLIELGTHRV